MGGSPLNPCVAFDAIIATQLALSRFLVRNKDKLVSGTPIKDWIMWDTGLDPIEYDHYHQPPRCSPLPCLACDTVGGIVTLLSLALPCLRHAGWHSHTCGFQVNHDRPKSSRFKGGSKPCPNPPHTRSPSVLLLPLHLCCCRYGALVQDGTRPGGAIEARAILCCTVWGSIYLSTCRARPDMCASACVYIGACAVLCCIALLEEHLPSCLLVYPPKLALGAQSWANVGLEPFGGRV
jgi:hypothetical protein